MTNKPLIFALSLLLIFSCQAMANKTPKQLKGSVVELESGEKIKGAVVTLEKDGEVIQSITTDESGNFELNYVEEKDQEGELKIKISKPGFAGKDAQPTADENAEMKFELKKKASIHKAVILPVGPAKHPDI